MIPVDPQLMAFLRVFCMSEGKCDRKFADIFYIIYDLIKLKFRLIFDLLL